MRNRLHCLAQFKSVNCLREARCTVARRKPHVLVHDSASYLSTHATLEKIREEECPDDLRGPIFDGHGVIPWHRIRGTCRAMPRVEPLWCPALTCA